MDRRKAFLLLLVLAVTAGETIALSKQQRLVKSAMARVASAISRPLQAMKRSETGGGITCFECKSSDPSVSSCVGSIVNCQAGEVCASVWHHDNTNYDGCMAPTLCAMLANSGIAYATCCDTNLCNTRK